MLPGEKFQRDTANKVELVLSPHRSLASQWFPELTVFYSPLCTARVSCAQDSRAFS